MFSLFLAAALAVTSAAGSLPLTNKEIMLLLRSGYSSDSVLMEVQSRHVLDRLDPAAKKSMIEFGANGQLVAALESGTYTVSGSDADQARAHQAEVAARRQAQIEQDQKFSTLYHAQQAAARAKATPALPPGETPILDSLKPKLVRCHDGTISRGDGSELEKKKFVALYYSAHWCAPCRKFTPQLIDYYNRTVAAHPEFEIVFVSSDRSRFGWETYIRETKMPWLAVDYDQLADVVGVRQLGGNSIPSLLVLDSASHLVATSYDGDNYLGPQNALAALDKIFASSGAK